MVFIFDCSSLLQRTIFQGLSQETLQSCIQSLIVASQGIEKRQVSHEGQHGAGDRELDLGSSPDSSLLTLNHISRSFAGNLTVVSLIVASQGIEKRQVSH